MKPPKFWFFPKSKPGINPYFLSPISKLWAGQTARRLANGKREKLKVPVICVGNANLGGTDKTPTTIALIEELKAMGKSPAVVMRGYGGSIEGPHRVNEAKDTYKETGDEALLISAFAPVWVSQDRAAGAKVATAQRHDVIILDDALQNPDLHHDLTIMVVDAEVGFGNGWVCPSGPLREPVETAMSRADMIVAIGDEDAQDELMEAWPILGGLPIVEGAIKPIETGMEWKDMRAYAFAGIGRPQKFFKSLRAEGATVVATRAFDDHEPFSLAVLKRMQAEAWAWGANLVTTEKDAVRLPKEMRPEVMTFPVRLHFEHKTILKEKLAGLFAKAG